LRVEKEFTVPVPLDRAWGWLTDADAVASCLVGGEVHKPDGERIYNSELTLSANGSDARCRTTLRPLEVDEDEHVTRLHVQGREVGGAGLGSGTLEGRLIASDGGTRVLLSADVAVTGHRADSQALDEGAAGVLAGFAERLERRMQEGRPEPAPAAGGPPPAKAAEPQLEPEPGHGPAIERIGRYGAVAAMVLLASLLLNALRRRPRKGLSVEITYRW
jgi:carbon monoxide dehydrogenase subunit G